MNKFVFSIIAMLVICNQGPANKSNTVVQSLWYNCEVYDRAKNPRNLIASVGFDVDSQYKLIDERMHIGIHFYCLESSVFRGYAERAYLECWNGGDWTKVTELFEPKVQFRNATYRVSLESHELVEKLWQLRGDSLLSKPDQPLRQIRIRFDGLSIK